MTAGVGRVNQLKVELYLHPRLKNLASQWESQPKV